MSQDNPFSQVGEKEGLAAKRWEDEGVLEWRLGRRELPSPPIVAARRRAPSSPLQGEEFGFAQLGVALACATEASNWALVVCSSRPCAFLPNASSGIRARP